MMQQQTSALASHPINPPSSSTTTSTIATTSLRSPTVTPAAQSQLPSPLSLAPLSSQGPSPHRQQSLPAPTTSDHAIGPLVPIAVAHPSSNESLLTMPCPLARVRLSDISPYDGAPAGNYVRAVEALSGSLMRHNAAVIELGCEDSALMRCGLEAARLYFRSRAQQGVGKGSRGVYMYRAGR